MIIKKAANTDVESAKRFRHYQQIGLVNPALCTDIGYHVYSDRSIHTLRTLRRFRGIRSSSKKIEKLQARWNDSDYSSAEIKAVALVHVKEIPADTEKPQNTADRLLEPENRYDNGACPNYLILNEIEGGR